MLRLLPALLVLSLLPPSVQAPAQDSDRTDTEKTVVVTGAGGERDNAIQPDLAVVERQIIEQTNSFRKERNRKPIEANGSLTKAAESFAQYMAKTGRYGHTADGSTPDDRVTAAGYELCIVRENIAYAFRSSGFSTEQLAERFVTGWKESPGHRRNMLAAHIVETGVAVAKSAETDTYFAVQLFARPKSAQFTFEVVNTSELTVSYRVGERTFPLEPQVVRTHTECHPQTVRFLPLDRETDRADPAAAVERVRVSQPKRLTVEARADGYRVTVGEPESDR